MSTIRWRRLLPLAIAVVLVGGIFLWGYQQYTVRKKLEVSLNNKYYRSFYDLLENVQNVEVLLSKVLVAQAPEQDSKIFTEIWQRANAAQANLNQLPLTDIATGRTSKFLTQVGDYSFTLLQKVAAGQPKCQKDWNTLQTLYRQTSTLNTELQDTERRIAEGKLYLGELAQQTGRVVQKEGPKLANGNFQKIEDNLKSFPTLIYDGPFSDKLEEKSAKGITGAKINVFQAKTRILGLIEHRPGTKYMVEGIRRIEGKIPAFQADLISTSGSSGGKERLSVAVSRQGGKLLWYTLSRKVASNKITLAEAREKAAQFLSEKGYKNVTPIYYEQGMGMVVFNFAATQNGVTLYPDQIKVTVALDNGQILGIEATDYLMTHHQRILPKPVLTLTQAREKLSPHLTKISSGRLTLIPRGTANEVLAYEFRGELDQDTFLIYINTSNGNEEQVLRLVRNKEGILSF